MFQEIFFFFISQFLLSQDSLFHIQLSWIEFLYIFFSLCTILSKNTVFYTHTHQKKKNKKQKQKQKLRIKIFFILYVRIGFGSPSPLRIVVSCTSTQTQTIELFCIEVGRQLRYSCKLSPRLVKWFLDKEEQTE